MPLPLYLANKNNTQIAAVRKFHEMDIADGFGEACRPEAFTRNIGPAVKDLGWQYLFPAKKRSIDLRSGIERRHHVFESGLQKAVRSAVTQPL